MSREFFRHINSEKNLFPDLDNVGWAWAMTPASQVMESQDMVLDRWVGIPTLKKCYNSWTQGFIYTVPYIVLENTPTLGGMLAGFIWGGKYEKI